MPEERSYEPRRFRSTVPFYERFRLGYPDRLIRRVVAFTGLSRGDAVLDLGAGPGLLAIPLAAAGMQVTAADPEPDMLDAAAEAARSAGVSLHCWRGGSYELTEAMGPFRLVTMGRAFHWMDRAATLQLLDRIIVPGGAIALFHDSHPETAENHWTTLVQEVADRYGRSGQSHVAERQSQGYRTHESLLLASAFNVIDGISVTIRQPLSADQIVGRAFSMSTCSHETLGERSAAFESDLRAALATSSPEFLEIAQIEAVVARRPEA